MYICMFLQCTRYIFTVWHRPSPAVNRTAVWEPQVLEKPPEAALTHHGAAKLSTDTLTNEIVLGGLAAP